MDPTAALIAQLQRLGRSTGTDLHDVGVSVAELTAALTTAVPSFLGLTITLFHDTGSLTLAAVGRAADRAASTSLRCSILLEGGGWARLVLYADQPGALTDLDADLTYLGRHANGHTGRRVPAVTHVWVDQDLPAPALAPGLIGLEEQSALSRAEGALIEQGVHPDEAAWELHRRAAALGLDPHRYSHQVLNACVTQPVRPPRPAT